MPNPTPVDGEVGDKSAVFKSSGRSSLHDEIRSLFGELST